MKTSRGKHPSDFFRPDERASVVEAIEAAEKLTSGEIRVHLEKKCPGGDPYYRGRDVFEDLGMTATALRNGVLIYMSIADRQVAVLGDRGIHERVEEGFWDAIVENLVQRFREGDYVGGLREAILQIGNRLATHFPYAGEGKDINELPNEISLGDDSED